MATATKKNEAAATVAASEGFKIQRVEELPPKPATARTNWWDSEVQPLLDAEPGEWFLVYEGDPTSPDPKRNALSRKVRAVRELDKRGQKDLYEFQMRDVQMYARRVNS